MEPSVMTNIHTTFRDAYIQYLRNSVRDTYRIRMPVDSELSVMEPSVMLLLSISIPSLMMIMHRDAGIDRGDEREATARVSHT